MQSVILLHGALGNASTLQPLTDALSGQFALHIPDLPGHGTRSTDNIVPKVETLTSFLQEYIRYHRIQQPLVFGYSLGGYVALHHALLYPGSISQIITFATKFHWNPEEALKQKKMLNGDVIEIKVPAFAEILKARHGEAHWKRVLDHTAEIMYHIGQSPLLTPDTLSQIAIPVTISVGSEDQMVTQQESLNAAQHLQNGEFRLLDGLPHAIEKIPGETLAGLINK